jgi:hypothetical protein
MSRELAALRAALRLAWQDEKIPAAPFIPDVPDDLKAKPREEIYSYEEVARLLEAAIRIPERWHVHRFAMTMLSTHGRVEAVLELDCDRQMKRGLPLPASRRGADQEAPLNRADRADAGALGGRAQRAS